MATRTTMTSNSSVRPTKRRKEARTDIWSSLLRQTREAQARSRTQAVQHRSLIVCGASPDDQRSFLTSLARPPSAQPPARNQERKQRQTKGDLKLSNRYAYGYGHVTLYSPPQQSRTGVPVLGAEAEETASVELHTIPEASKEYVGTLRTLLCPQAQTNEGNADKEFSNDEIADQEHVDERKPGICILLNWKEPWKFLDQLRAWIQLIAKALLNSGMPATDPMDILKDAQLCITVVVLHTEAQEDLFREGYKEEDFDYISQCLRTAILPLHPFSALVYISLTAPPQQPGSALSEAQKVIYTSLGLDLASLSPKLPRSGDSAKREELGPKHEFMDRMAIVIPAGWDSAAFIRTLSETFSPEDVLAAWLNDLQPLPEPIPRPALPKEESQADISTSHSNGGTEVFESSPVDETSDDLSEPPLSPSKLASSTVRTYQSKVFDPQAHRQPKAPTIEVTTKPDQKFLAEMREHLQQLEAHDREREVSGRSTGISTTSLSSSRMVGMPSGDSTGALNELGDVSFNVGGVSYDTTSAEAAIERLRRPPASSDLRSPLSPTPRTSTPKPPRANRDLNDDRRPSSERGTSTPGGPGAPGSAKGVDSKDLPIDKLEEYFQSLMKGGGGAGSRSSTPTRKTGE